LNTKIHAVVDGLGNPVEFFLSPGNDHDATHAIELLDKVEIEGSNVLGDRAYDTDAILEYLETRRAISVIPPKANRTVQRDCDWWLYKERHLVECFFQKIKWFRRVATRYDKSDESFLGFVYLAAISILVK
jgi:transposase